YDIQDKNSQTMLGLPQDIATIASLGTSAVYKIASIRRVSAAVKDITMSAQAADTAKTVQEVKAVQAAGHGDLGEAAVQTVTNDLTAKFEQRENVNQEAIRSLPSMLKTDTDAIQTNVGSRGNDIVNRIKQRMEQREIDVAKGTEQLLKVNRTPVVVANEDVARSLRVWAKDKYAGPNSTVLDGTGRTLLLDVPSNTYHMNLDIGNHNGEMFSNEAELVSHAELYGIPLESGETTTRRYWDDRATAAAFQVEDVKQRLAKFDEDFKAKFGGYTKQSFKPKTFHAAEKERAKLVDELKEWNARKAFAWQQRAGAFWQPDKPIAAKLGATVMEQQGKGWYIRRWVPLDETASPVRSALLKMPGAWSGPVRKAPRKGTETPYLKDLVTGTETDKFAAQARVFLDTFLGGEKGEGLFQGLRSPEETLSPEENAQRKVAVHTPSKMMDLMFKEDIQILQNVPEKELGDLRRVLISN